MLWFTADTHFGHLAVLSYGNRPWADVDAMDEGLIERWNDCVKPNDVVWHLGDFSFRRREETAAIFARLNGEKHLVVGNHDGRRGRDVAKLPWASVHDLHRLRWDGQRLILCHYPMLTWDGAHHGIGHLHGHSHGNLRAPESTRIDVGADVHDWRPVSFDWVMTTLASRTYRGVDHHEAKASA